MTASTRPHGRLPARVYWFRRALVLGTALALVFGIAHVVGGSDPDPTSGAPRAQVVAARPTPAALQPMGPQVLRTGAATPTATKAAAVLPQPDGPCALDEITATPASGAADAGVRIPLTVQLTGIRPACTFSMSSATLVVKISSGTERVWSSQDCPSSIRSGTVVVRSGTPTAVQVIWNGRHSDAQCTRAAAWALPGTYRVLAAAIGSEPGDALFTLKAPPRPVVIKTVRPKPKQKPNNGATANAGG